MAVSLGGMVGIEERCFFDAEEKVTRAREVEGTEWLSAFDAKNVSKAEAADSVVREEVPLRDSSLTKIDRGRLELGSNVHRGPALLRVSMLVSLT